MNASEKQKTLEELNERFGGSQPLLGLYGKYRAEPNARKKEGLIGDFLEDQGIPFLSDESEELTSQIQSLFTGRDSPFRGQSSTPGPVEPMEETQITELLKRYVKKLKQFKVTYSGEPITARDLIETSLSELNRRTISKYRGKEKARRSDLNRTIDDGNLKLIKPDLYEKLIQFSRSIILKINPKPSRKVKIINFASPLQDEFKLGLSREDRDRIYKEFEQINEDYKELIELFSDPKFKKLDFVETVREKNLVKKAKFMIEDDEFSPKEVSIYDAAGAAAAMFDTLISKLGFMNAFQTMAETTGSESEVVTTRFDASVSEESIEDELIEFEDKFKTAMEKVILDPLAVLHVNQNLNGLAVKSDVLGTTREDALNYLREIFIEPMFDEIQGNEVAVKFEQDVEEIIDDLFENLEELEDYASFKVDLDSEGMISQKQGADYYLPNFLAQHSSFSGIYRSVEQNEDEIKVFLDAVVDFYFGEDKPVRAATMAGADFPKTPLGNAQSRTSGQMDVAVRRATDRNYYSLNLPVKKKRATAKKFEEKLSELLEKTFIKAAQLCEELDYLVFYRNHPFVSAIESSSSLRGSFEAKVNRGLSSITSTQIKSITNFFNQFKEPGEVRDFDKLARQARQASRALASFFGKARRGPEQKQVLKEMAAFIGYQMDLQGLDKKTSLGFREFEKSPIELYKDLKINEPRDIEYLNAMILILAANPERFEENVQGLLSLGRDFNILSDKAYVKISKALLEAHDNLRLLKGEQVHYGLLSYENVEDIIKMQNYLEQRNLDLTALEIENIVKAIDSFKSIGLEYGVSSDSVYLIKANFR